MYDSPSQTLFWQGSDSTGWTLTDLGSQYYRYSNEWVNELIGYYGGEDPRSYIGYLDSLWDYLRTPSDQPLDLNEFYYGPSGVITLNNLKSTYDPAGIFPNGPTMKPINVADAP